MINKQRLFRLLLDSARNALAMLWAEQQRA
jgi:hypothetical protein